MRTSISAWLVMVTLVAGAIGQEPKAPAKTPASDQEVVSMVGARLAKVFAKFGAPKDMFVTGATSDEPSVCLDYGEFGYLVRNKTVQSCLFWQAWKTSACGVKLGETADDVTKKFGKAENVNTDPDGAERMYWDYKANDEVMRLQVSFNKDKKCSRVVLNLK